ncbi:hypothetical protein SLEP1_g3416 [Rubroshorea leprosula]|uniref:Transposase n=1 Tax=Rubroshorea leprosula TaxID=152421 RepID=A0AAV5HU35_9ROSI|nr:hypothetical protein SLEP1_g3416 [Rubroshorea leprosula]
MPRESTLTIGGRSKKAKIGQHKGPIDLYMYQKPEETLKKRKLEKCRQSSIKDSNKELRAETIQYIARFFYQNGISFNVARSESFKLMVEAIEQYGKNLKPPNYHELRVSCLNKELEYTKKLMEYHKKQWPRYGVTIMSDGWTDKRQRSIINFLVNSPAGTMFVKSIDASAFLKSGEKLFELIDSVVEEIGEKHVVQLVTDNGSNYVLAGKLLEEKRKHIFWTPCAAHCIDLILEDVRKISKVKKTIQRAMSLVGFIYNHSSTLNLMRRFTNKTELVRYGVTRFATNFLSLQSVYKQKASLRKMFTSDEWTSSKLARDAKGVKAPDVNLQLKIYDEVAIYNRAQGRFGDDLAIKSRDSKSPAEWWTLFGHSAPNLQKLAIKILSLTCSASGCERNWSVFEQIHSKKRNRLDHQKMHDLVFVKYNQALKARYNMRDEIDPIVLNEIDFDNEWLVGESGEVEDAHNDLVFENDNLTWGDVERASGAREIRTYTRGQAKKNTTAAFTSQIPALTFKTPATTSSVDAIYATRISEKAHTLLDLEKSEEEEEEFEPGGTS